MLHSHLAAVEVPSDIRLGKLNRVLQDVMGWTNSHLHEFVIFGEHFGVKDPDDPNMKPEARVAMEDVLPEEGCEFMFLYDFGDSWEHDVVVEKMGPWRHVQNISHCLEGERACPPEDVGGTHGYEELVESMRGRIPKNGESLWLGWVRSMTRRLSRWIGSMRFCGFTGETLWRKPLMCAQYIISKEGLLLARFFNAKPAKKPPAGEWWSLGGWACCHARRGRAVVVGEGIRFGSFLEQRTEGKILDS